MPVLTYIPIAMQQREGVPAKCKRCGHEWIYRGQKLELLRLDIPMYTVCSVCRTSVRLRLPEK